MSMTTQILVLAVPSDVVLGAVLVAVLVEVLVLAVPSAVVLNAVLVLIVSGISISASRLSGSSSRDSSGCSN